MAEYDIVPVGRAQGSIDLKFTSDKLTDQKDKCHSSGEANEVEQCIKRVFAVLPDSDTDVLVEHSRESGAKNPWFD